MTSATRRRLGPLTLRVWGIILGVVLVLPLVVGGLTSRHVAAVGVWPWRTGAQRPLIYALASAWLVLAFVVGMWLLFMALVVGRRRRLFMWSFILLVWIYLLERVGLVTMFRPMSAIQLRSLQWLFVPTTMGGYWLGIYLVAASVLAIAIVEQLLRRRDGSRRH